MIDLVSERAGGRILGFNDEFFAAAENLIKASAPIANDEYTDRGKWMDGWETRRRREPGHDWCVIQLGISGRIEEVTVDTSHFTGNYAERFSLEGGARGSGREEWIELVPETGLEGDSVARFPVEASNRIDVVRLNIFPDGGVARLRLSGTPIPGMSLVCPETLTDLASAALGAVVVDASNMHYSDPSNCLLPTSSAGMWDGWETKRRRDEGHDWVVVRLGVAGSVEKVVVDTTHFKGNAPGWVSLEVSADGEDWDLAIDRAPVAADAMNEIDMESSTRASLVRLSIHPDGGLARFRVLGRAHPDAAGPLRLGYLNALLRQPAAGFFGAACKSDLWVQSMVDSRPFNSVDAVLETAESKFDLLADEDWLEAFSGHPKIGEKGDQTSAREQAGSAGHESELATLNQEYEEKFGFIYIVYATEKTGREMLDIARSRLTNSRAQELQNAAEEQRKITATRLRRMLCQGEL